MPTRCPFQHEIPPYSREVPEEGKLDHINPFHQMRVTEVQLIQIVPREEGLVSATHDLEDIDILQTSSEEVLILHA